MGKTYVISDIHGDFVKYQKMISQINLKDSDTLYILGDIIDRGNGGVKILQDMMLRPNVFPILGNHEFLATLSIPLLLQGITKEKLESDKERFSFLTDWIKIGGESTISELSKLDNEDVLDILEYFLEFEVFTEIEVEDKKFILVHAGVSDFTKGSTFNDYTLEVLVQDRLDYNKVYFDDAYLVSGHTPTRIIYAREEGKRLAELNISEYKDEVYMKNNHIAIDCGCGSGGKLGCICLNTFEIYYV